MHCSLHSDGSQVEMDEDGYKGIFNSCIQFKRFTLKQILFYCSTLEEIF